MRADDELTRPPEMIDMPLTLPLPYRGLEVGQRTNVNSFVTKKAFSYSHTCEDKQCNNPHTWHCLLQTHTALRPPTHHEIFTKEEHGSILDSQHLQASFS